MNLLMSLLINGLAVFVVAQLLPGVEITGYVPAVIVAILLCAVNSFIKPVITILTLPITILTLGLFLFIVNGGMVLLVDHLLGGFFVDGWIWAIVFSIVLSFVNLLFQGFFSNNKA